MIISDLNHLETVSQSVEITGGNSLITLLFPQSAVLTSFSETSQTLNGTQVDSTAGTLVTQNGTNIAFAASVSSSTSP